MAGNSFLRKYRLVIGEANSSGKTSTVKESAVITESQIEFDITRTSDSKNNTMSLKIYNLSEDTIGVFDKKDFLVSLEVGYGTNPTELIFRGNKTFVHTERSETEVVTTIQAAEGFLATREGRVSRSLPPGSTVKQIIEAIVSDGFPTMTLNATGEALNKVYDNGYSIIGGAKQNLDMIASVYQLDWH